MVFLTKIKESNKVRHKQALSAPKYLCAVDLAAEMGAQFDLAIKPDQLYDILESSGFTWDPEWEIWIDEDPPPLPQ